MKILKFGVKMFALVALVTALGACNGSENGSSDNGSQSGSGSNSGSSISETASKDLPKHNESEVLADYHNLTNIEHTLATMGMVFLLDSMSDPTTNTVRWSQSTIHDYEQEKGIYNAATEHEWYQSLIAPMQNYIDSANTFLQKYAGEFNVQKSNGKLSTETLREFERSAIKGKIDLATKTLPILKGTN